MGPFGVRALCGMRPPRPRLATRLGWVCPSCQPRRGRQWRWNSSESLPAKKGKPYYITTPIFYVNAGTWRNLDTSVGLN